MDVAVEKHRWEGLARPGLRDNLVIALFLLACAFFLFFDLRIPPIILWDESRTAVNALEMRQTGLSLVTTYGFEPDLWNTKPPLLIWLMTASMALFGPTEWAMRLPSALAALGTLLLVILFTRRITGSLATGLLAAAFLTLSPGFFGEHGARTADYDALLLLFVTAYGQLLFLAIHKNRPPLGLMFGIGLLIAGAVLTKSSAGLAPGMGIAAYMLATGRWRRLFRSPAYLWMAFTAILPPFLFFVLREAAAPGYVDAAFFNDAAGRFNQSLVAQERPFWFYAGSLWEGWFAASWLLLLLPLVRRHITGKSRALTTYCLVFTAIFLILVSMTSTRLLHYALPVFPFLAMATAIIGRAAVDCVRQPGVRPLARVLIIALCTFVAVQAFGRGALARYDRFPARQFYAQASLFARLAEQGVREVTVVDAGFPLVEWPHYTPLLDGYRLIWREKGLTIHKATALQGTARGIVASCDPPSVRQLAKLGPDIGGTPGCIALRLTPPAAPPRKSPA